LWLLSISGFGNAARCIAASLRFAIKLVAEDKISVPQPTTHHRTPPPPQPNNQHHQQEGRKEGRNKGKKEDGLKEGSGR
jgi:hypothetical protein